MFAGFSERVHAWMGWCPDRKMAHLIAENCQPPEMTILASLPEKESFVNDVIIADYGKTGISLPFFIGSLIGVIGIIAFFILIIQAAFLQLAGIMFWSLIFLAAIGMFYQDLKMACLEITRDALIIHRSLHLPAIIHKENISSMEIRQNKPPLPVWLQNVLFFLLMPVLAAGTILGEYLQYSSGGLTSPSFFLHLGVSISIVLFFLAIHHHFRIRSDYPEILVITTNSQEQAGIYGENLKEIAESLERSV